MVFSCHSSSRLLSFLRLTLVSLRRHAGPMPPTKLRWYMMLHTQFCTTPNHLMHQHKPCKRQQIPWRSQLFFTPESRDHAYMCRARRGTVTDVTNITLVNLIQRFLFALTCPATLTRFLSYVPPSLFPTLLQRITVLTFHLSGLGLFHSLATPYNKHPPI